MPPLFQLFTPGMTLSEMRDVTAAIKVLGSEVIASDVSVEFKGAFGDFVAAWQVFYNDNEGVFSRSMNATWDKVQDYKRLVEAWKESFVDAGGVSRLPSLVSTQLSGKESWKKWLLLAGLGGVVGWIVSSQLNKLTSGQ